MHRPRSPPSPPPSTPPDHCPRPSCPYSLPLFHPSLCRCRFPSFLSTNLLEPRARFLFSSGNRLVKVITLIIYRPDTPSHLFQWAGRECIPVSFSSAARFLLRPAPYSPDALAFSTMLFLFFFLLSLVPVRLHPVQNGVESDAWLYA